MRKGGVRVRLLLLLLCVNQQITNQLWRRLPHLLYRSVMRYLSSSLLTFLPWALGNTNQHFSPFSDISNWGVNGYNHKLKCRVMLVYKLTLCTDVCNAHVCLCVNQSITVTFNPWSQVYRGAGRGSRVTSPWCAETQLGSSWHEAESMWWSASSTGRRKTGECQRVWSTVPTFQLLAGPLSFSCVTTLSCTSLWLAGWSNPSTLRRVKNDIPGCTQQLT